MIGERFYVVALEGWENAATSSAHPQLSCYVLDRAYCHREVARVKQPQSLPGFRRGHDTRATRRAWVRSEAERRAAELNAEHGAA